MYVKCVQRDTDSGTLDLSSYLASWPAYVNYYCGLGRRFYYNETSNRDHIRFHCGYKVRVASAII